MVKVEEAARPTTTMDDAVHPRKRKIKMKEPESEPPLVSLVDQPMNNCYETFLNIRKQVSLVEYGMPNSWLCSVSASIFSLILFCSGWVFGSIPLYFYSSLMVLQVVYCSMTTPCAPEKVENYLLNNIFNNLYFVPMLITVTKCFW